MNKFGIGQPVPRVEDPRFITGRGRYVDDFDLPHQCYGVVVMSPHAHARIKRVDTAKAKAAAGVLAVLTGAEVLADRLGGLVPPMPEDMGGPKGFRTLRAILEADKVRAVGDRVAFVVAETLVQAKDAAELIEIDYQPLPAVIAVEDAVKPGAPALWDEAPNNVAFTLMMGNKDATDAAFANAKHVVSLKVNNSRITANSIEPRAAIGQYHPEADSYTLYSTSQNPHGTRSAVAGQVLKIPETKLRVISPDVGGGFGVKGNFAVEVSTIAWAAQLLRRPVRWTATRTDTFLSDAQARDHHTQARMGFDRDGRIVAMQVDTLAALGGYLSNFAPSIPGNSYPQTITGLYRTPNLHLRVRGVYTNTVPVDAYRGSGRPEATWTNERLIERAAHELGIDAVEMRRRNLIGRADFPYPALGGRTYDSGDPPALLEKLLALADYPALRKQQAELRGQNILMGIGLACFIDKAGTGPSANLALRGGLHGGWESAIVRVHSDGKITVLAGSHSHGQGHDITFAQIAADRLKLDIDDIRLVEGDTDRIPFGNGTWGARSVSVAGTAIYRASDRIIAKARSIAAEALECAEPDIVHERGRFRVHGTDRSISFATIADLAYHGANLGEDGSPGLEVTEFYDPPDTNDPQAMHLAVVIVDSDTGAVTLRALYAADDCGMIVNPMIVEGQVHGGMAQGVGQALMEHIVYDRDGQLLTGSFMDYAMPRAADLPAFHTGFIATPAPSNPLGVKGGSESGTIGAPAAIGNAVIDALWHRGVRDIALPISAETVWRALKTAQESAPRD